MIGASRLLVAVACVSALVISSVVAPPPARAQNDSHLSRARAALKALKFRRAETALLKALRTGEHKPSEMAEIYQLLGEVYAAQDQGSKAKRYFRRLLSLRPKASLPLDTSPKLLAPFADAKRDMKRRKRLSIRCVPDLLTSRITVEVRSDPLEMIVGARIVHRRDGGEIESTQAKGKQAISLALPAGDGVELFCAAIDEHGNHLAEVGSLTDPLSLSPGTTTPRDPWYKHWLTWTAATGAVGGLSLIFGLQSRTLQQEFDEIRADSMQHDFVAAERVEQRGRRYAFAANLGFVVTAMGAVVSVWRFARRPKDNQTSSFVSAIPLDRGAGISFSFRFW